eukprot:313873-Pyramimonas_sp.AAC.1
MDHSGYQGGYPPAPAAYPPAPMPAAAAYPPAMAPPMDAMGRKQPNVSVVMAQHPRASQVGAACVHP